jgi:hypothetical protein
MRDSDRDPVLGSGIGQVLTAAEHDWTVIDTAAGWSAVHRQPRLTDLVPNLAGRTLRENQRPYRMEGGSGMTDIDPTSDIEVSAADGQVMVRVPLAGRVSGDWLRRYQRLARATEVPVQAQAHPDRAWIVVNVPADANQRDVSATLDAARALIAEADAADRAPATAQTESVARDWWARRQISAPHKPISKVEVVRTGIGTEKRWPLIGALIVAMAIPLLLPSRFSLGPSWVVPVVVAVLLVAIVAADRARSGHLSSAVRALSLALVVVLVVEAAGVTARLIVDLVKGGPETNNATDLLSVGFGVWIYTILAFAFLYWILDGGGPDARLWAPPEFPDLAFPERLTPVVAPPGWRPLFFDYLYLGFTNATAFSPTDVMPLARWAKAAMALQATTSLVILGLVIARAVNILR